MLESDSSDQECRDSSKYKIDSATVSEHLQAYSHSFDTLLKSLRRLSKSRVEPVESILEQIKDPLLRIADGVVGLDRKLAVYYLVLEITQTVANLPIVR